MNSLKRYDFMYYRLKNTCWLYPLLLIVSVWAVYFPVLGNDFQYPWDDQWVVMNRYTERSLNRQNLWADFTCHVKGYKKAILIAGLAAYLLCFGGYTNLRSRVGYDSETLKREVLELRNEGTVSYNNLLRHFYRERAPREAGIRN